MSMQCRIECSAAGVYSLVAVAIIEIGSRMNVAPIQLWNQQRHSAQLNFLLSSQMSSPHLSNKRMTERHAFIFSSPSLHTSCVTMQVFSRLDIIDARVGPKTRPLFKK